MIDNKKLIKDYMTISILYLNIFGFTHVKDISIIAEMKTCLREERDPSDILTSYSLKEYERLMSESPSISGSAIEAFHARFKNSEQTKPDIALESFVIDICKDYESTLVLDSKDTDDKDNL